MQSNKIIESLRLEKTSKIINSHANGQSDLLFMGMHKKYLFSTDT